LSGPAQRRDAAARSTAFSVRMRQPSTKFGRPGHGSSPQFASAASRTRAPLPAVVRNGVPAPSIDRRLDAPPSQAALVHTGRGGVLYLLNVALALELYGDFTRPMAPRIPLDPWDFVELIARRLGAAEGAPDDPIWALLGRLSGRPPGRRPGLRFRPHPDWRIDPAWLEPFAADHRPWRWWSTDGRLVVEHPAGFRIVDIARPGDLTPGDVRRALGPCRATALRRTSRRPAAERRSARDRWLDATAAFVRARLALALGPAAARRLSTVMFDHEAEIAVTASAVDVSFRLDRLPIAIRIAGLDRDPGWIPAAGRSITFRFA